MQIKETIEALNQRIAIDETIKAYSLTERLTVDKKTILSADGQDTQVSIDDSFNAVLWHRLLSANYSPYAGRGSVNQMQASYRVRLVCYSNDLGISDFIASQIQSDNSMALQSASFDKETIIKQELPEAKRNFNINHYLFTIEYQVSLVVDPNCYCPKPKPRGFLRFNAKVYDGAFDYDVLSGYTLRMDYTDRVTALFALRLDGYGRFFATRDASGGAGATFRRVPGSNKLNVFYRSAGADLISATFAEPIADGYHVIVFRKTGSAFDPLEFDFWVDGVRLTPETLSTTGTANSTLSDKVVLGAFDTNGVDPFQGLIRRTEVITGNLTEVQIKQVSGYGSMQGIGIEYNRDSYLLAVDYNKADGQSPTAITAEGQKELTSFGGAQYQKYYD